MSFFRSKMLGVVLGMVMLAGLGAAVAVIASSLTLPSALIGASAPNGARATTTPAGAATGTTTATATATTATIAATATTPRATNTPVVRPSPTWNNQATSVRGTVVSVDVNAGQFVISSNGVQVTVHTTGATQFTGAASSLSTLGHGMWVRAQGASQATDDFLATSVNSSTDN